MLSGGNESVNYERDRLCTADTARAVRRRTSHDSGYLQAGIASAAVCVQNSQKIGARWPCADCSGDGRRLPVDRGPEKGKPV